MKKFTLISVFTIFMVATTPLFGQAKLAHITELSDPLAFEKFADVEGFLMMEMNTALPLQHHALKSDFIVMDGWPVKNSGSSSRGCTYGNLDDDDELEIIYNLSTKIYAINPDGSIVDGWPVSVSSSAEYGAPAYGDVNGDGYDDVVVSTRQPGTGNTGKIYAFNRDGTNLPGFPVTADGGPTKTPVLADLDNDGALEIIVELRKWPDGKVCVYKGDASIMEGWPQTMDYIPASSVAVGDITGDEIPEIVAESYYMVWAYDINGNVLDGFPYEPGTDRVFSYSSPVLADLDDDGFREIVVGDHSLTAGNGAVHVIHNNGTVMDGWPKYTSQWIYGPASVADIDGDGEPDVAIGDQVLSPTPANKVYAWDKTGQYLPGFPIGPIDAINCQIIVADLDGDEMMELCFDDNTGNGILNGYNHDGTMMTGWPLEVNGSSFFTNATVLDATGDLNLNLTATSYDSGTQETWMYLWGTDVSFVAEKAPLPILQYNVRHSGVYGETSNPVVSINKKPGQGDLSVWCTPNPCREYTVLNFKGNAQTNEVYIFDEVGAMVNLINVSAKSSLKIDTSGLNAGVYIVVLAGEVGNMAQAKFIKLD